MESTQTVTKVSLQPPQQVVGLAGSESPLTVSSNTNNQRSRHDLSRARLRALESSLEDGQLWVPPSPSHRKTWEEQVSSNVFITTNFLVTWYVTCYPIADKPQITRNEGAYWAGATWSFPLQKAYWLSMSCSTWLYATSWGETWGYSSATGYYLSIFVILSGCIFRFLVSLKKDTVLCRVAKVIVSM